VVDRILEQEEAAAELVAGTFDRALELSLGGEGTSPLTPVTPLGKPPERGVTPHPGDSRPKPGAALGLAGGPSCGQARGQRVRSAVLASPGVRVEARALGQEV